MTNFSGRWDQLDTVELNGEFYRLVRSTDQQNGSQAHLPYVEQFLDEPPYAADGLPALLSEQTYTWHLGGFKSRQGIPGTYETAVNADGSWAFRLLPSAKINTLTLTGSAAAPTSFFETLGYVWVVAGQRVYRIHPTTGVVTLSKTFGGSTIAIMGMQWENSFGLVTTDDTTNSLWRVDAIGSPDTWTQTPDVEAYRLVAGLNRLFKITKTGELKNISTGLDPLVDANWADSVQVGYKWEPPTSMVSYERTVLVGKAEGLFGVGDNGLGLPLIKRMIPDVNNCRGMCNFDPYVIVPHLMGLYRYLPGSVESVGAEKELMNESTLTGRWTAFASDGDTLYGAMLVSGVTYIFKGRERRSGESGFSPIIWHPWLAFAGECHALHVSIASTNARLYFGAGVDAGYVELKRGAGAIEYATTGLLQMPKLKFDNWYDKDFPRIDLVGRNLDANNHWTVAYSLDGGAFVSTDVNGATMRKNTNGRSSFFLPTSVVGREIQWRFTYTYDGSGDPPELNYIEAYSVPQSRKVARITFNLALEEGIRHGQGSDERTVAEQLNDLVALAESATAISSKGPWGESVNVWLKSPRIVDMVQRGQDKPIWIVQVSLQLRETS